MGAKNEERAVAALDEHMERVESAAWAEAGQTAPRRNGKPMMQLIHEANESLDEEEMQIRMEAWQVLLEMIWGDGLNPARAFRRLVAVTWIVARHHIAWMDMTELGLLMHETKAAWSFRVRVLYTDFLRKMGFRGVRMSGQKAEASIEKYREAATNNTNRRAGRKLGDDAPHSVELPKYSKADKAKLEAARAAARARELERLAKAKDWRAG